MRDAFPVTGILAVILMLISIAGITSRLPRVLVGPTVPLIAVVCCFVASIFAARSSGLSDRVMGKVVLAVLVILVLLALFMPAISHT